jgi:hypothetical protein
VRVARGTSLQRSRYGESLDMLTYPALGGTDGHPACCYPKFSCIFIQYTCNIVDLIQVRWHSPLAGGLDLVTKPCMHSPPCSHHFLALWGAPTGTKRLATTHMRMQGPNTPIYTCCGSMSGHSGPWEWAEPWQKPLRCTLAHTVQVHSLGCCWGNRRAPNDLQSPM